MSKEVVTEEDKDLSKKEAADLLADDKAKAKERRKPKEYSIDTLKRPLNKDEEKEFNKLSKEEQKVFIIKKWIAENRTLDKSEMHEVSLDDEKEAGLVPS